MRRMENEWRRRNKKKKMEMEKKGVGEDVDGEE